MHAKPDLRVVLKWMIAGSGSVIADVVTLQPLPLTSTNHELYIMTTLLWLDDERDPTDSRWHRYFPVENPTAVWVKTYEEFVEWVNVNSLPDAICFDHDLGDGLSGMDAAKWLTEYCLDRNQKLPLWSIQSANPIGKNEHHGPPQFFRTSI